MLMEQLEYNLLFRWFVGLNMDDVIWDATVFSKNRDRMLKSDIAALFFQAVVEEARVMSLFSDEHFSVDGTLIEREDDRNPCAYGERELSLPNRSLQRQVPLRQKSDRLGRYISQVAMASASRRGHPGYCKRIRSPNCARYWRSARSRIHRRNPQTVADMLTSFGSAINFLLCEHS
jgi:hypothetical protein